MAIFVNRGQHIYVGGYSLAPYFTQATLQWDSGKVDKTSLADTTRTYMTGIAKGEINLDGYDDMFAGSGSFDELFNPVNGTVVNNIYYTLCPQGAGTEGNPSYTMRGTRVGYDKTMALGEMLKFKWKIVNDGAKVVPGKVLAGNIVASGNSNSTGFNWQALSASQVMYGTLHVTTAGTGLIVKIQSDDNGGFTTPTDRITFASTSTIGQEQLTVNGAVADTYWRAIWTRSSGSPVFTVVAGIM